MTCRDDAIKAVDAEWRGAREIHERVGKWSASAVRHALVKLSSEHLVDVRSFLPDGARSRRFEYRVRQAKA